MELIDKNNRNISARKLKGAIRVWIDILRYDKNQLKAISDKELTHLLNNEFENLNLSELTDGKHIRGPINKTALTLYKAKLLAQM